MLSCRHFFPPAYDVPYTELVSNTAEDLRLCSVYLLYGRQETSLISHEEEKKAKGLERHIKDDFLRRLIWNKEKKKAY